MRLAASRSDRHGGREGKCKNLERTPDYRGLIVVENSTGIFLPLSNKGSTSRRMNVEEERQSTANLVRERIYVVSPCEGTRPSPPPRIMDAGVLGGRFIVAHPLYAIL